jgi:hypothetical protein
METNTIKSFTQLISRIVAAYQFEKYAFIDENFIDFSGTADQHLPAVLFNIERVEIDGGVNPFIKFVFNLTVIRPKQAYDSCIDISIIKDGTNPVDTDERFVTQVLYLLSLQRTNCGKYAVTNGTYTGALQLGNMTAHNATLAGAYAFVVRGITATAKQPTMTKIGIGQYFDLAALDIV